MPQITIDHITLKNYMKQLCYRSDDGICYGFSYMALQAVLVKDSDSFNNRLVQIDECVKYGKSPTNDIHAFFQGVELNHQGYLYQILFDHTNASLVPKNQNGTLTMPLTLSKKLDELGGVVEAMSFTGIYDVNDLIWLLNSYVEVFSTSFEKNITTSFIILHRRHAINLTYNFESKIWIRYEINNLSSCEFYGTKDLVKQMFKDFFISDTGHLALSIKMFCVKKDSDAIAKLTENWHENFAFKYVHSSCQDKLNRVDSLGWKWVNFAIHVNDYPTLTKILSDENFNPNSNDGEPILCQSVIKGNVEIVSTLLDHKNIDPNKYSLSKETPLCLAIKLGNVAIVELLLTHKLTNPNLVSPELLTFECAFSPLCLALIHHDKNLDNAIFNILLSHPFVDVNYICPQGETPLYTAVDTYNEFAIKALLAKGANPDIVCHGESPLYCAVSLSYHAGIKALLENGANPNQACSDEYQDTPLHLAIDNEDCEAIRLLLDANADIFKLNAAGKSPLDVADKLENKSVLHLLIDLMENPTSNKSLKRKLPAEEPPSKRQRTDFSSSYHKFTLLSPVNDTIYNKFSENKINIRI